MGFFTIFVPAGLSERDYRRALRSGPSFVSSGRRDHNTLFIAAGFELVDEIDLTDEFEATARAWPEARARYRDQLVAAEGNAAFDERQDDAIAQLHATHADGKHVRIAAALQKSHRHLG